MLLRIDRILDETDQSIDTVRGTLFFYHYQCDGQDDREILVQLEDKPSSFIRSKQWIGTCEATMVLSQLYDVDCKIIHIPNGRDLGNYIDILARHFREFGSPVMMGGDADAASKCILAVRSNEQLLILDPHYSGRSLTSTDELRQSGYLKWYHVPNDFVSSSFYNLCLPQLKKL